MRETDTCPVCQSNMLIPVAHRRTVPVHQNLVLDDQAAARAITRGDLDFVACADCGFGFNRAFDLGKLAYGAQYDNNQTCSAAFRDHLGALTQTLIHEKGVRDCIIVEVGCGNGAFLRQLVLADDRNRGHGFDPAYVGPGTDLDGRLKFHRRFYDAVCADIRADVVVCRHVIEHVPDPLSLLAAIRQALAGSPHARVFFETPCLEWILRHQVIWDLFYEHCSIFTLDSLSTALEASGFRVEDRRHVFGGQYLWVEATVSGGKPIVHLHPGSISTLAHAFAAAEDSLKREWAVKLQAIAATGKLALWGAGAKGVTLANLVDPQAQWVDCVVDLNPNKQGKYLPGTGHPIVPYQSLGLRGVRAVMVMNPNYRTEIATLLHATHPNIALLS